MGSHVQESITLYKRKESVEMQYALIMVTATIHTRGANRFLRSFPNEYCYKTSSCYNAIILYPVWIGIADVDLSALVGRPMLCPIFSTTHYRFSACTVIS